MDSQQHGHGGNTEEGEERPPPHQQYQPKPNQQSTPVFNPFDAMDAITSEGIISAVYGMVKGLLQEIFPFLSSREVFRNSLQMTQKSVLNSPCSAIFYTLITLLGVFPIVCFMLTILSIFLLGVVWFVFSQVTLFCLASVVFGGLMFLIVGSSFFAAITLGVSIHTFYLWRWLKAYLSENWRDLLYYLLEFGGKPGIWVIEQIDLHDSRNRRT